MRDVIYLLNLINEIKEAEIELPISTQPKMICKDKNWPFYKKKMESHLARMDLSELLGDSAKQIPKDYAKDTDAKVHASIWSIPIDLIDSKGLLFHDQRFPLVCVQYILHTVLRRRENHKTFILTRCGSYHVNLIGRSGTIRNVRRIDPR